MPAFLDPEWQDRLADAAATAGPGPDLVLEIGVTTADDTDVRWTVRSASTGVVVEPGPAADADIRIGTDEATAAAIARGRASAQRAFLDGRLRVGGDVARLAEARAALAALPDVFAPLRDGTEFPDA